MSMLRYLTPGGGKGRLHPPPRGSSSTSAPTVSDGQPRLRLGVPNYGILYLPAPEAPQPDGSDSNEPRDDPMLHGDLEITISGGSGPRRCKAIRVGLKTTITLDLGQGRRFEEDVLFERKVEIISSTADGLWLEEGPQRFDFTIIVPANLASHDWHTNGVISHVLYAEVEGLPEANDWNVGRSMSSTSLFGLRKTTSRSGSKQGSRGVSPTQSPPLSPSLLPRLTRTPSSTSFASSPPVNSTSIPHSASSPGAGCSSNHNTALSNLSLGASRSARTPAPIDIRRASTASSVGGGNGSPLASPGTSPVPIPTRGGSGLNPAHLSAAQSLSVTRQESGLPRAPSYDDAIKETEPKNSDWLTGVHRVKRNCMVVYNPDPAGGVNELSERANGFVPGLGVWEMQLLSDVWSIGALLSFRLEILSLSALTSIFSIKLLMNQTHSIISPRDDGPDAKRVSTRTFTIFEEGKRPPAGSQYPDRRHPAIWRGKGAGGKEDPEQNGKLVIDRKCRLPNDNVGRPSTLPGVITPISVSHTISLEVAFSVWGEDDMGKKMQNPTHGGLRLLRVQRPVFIPSCCLVPAVLDLPTYESHAKDPLAPPTEQMPTGLPGWEWCACGWKIEELEARMRQSIIAQRTEAEAMERTARANSSTLLSPTASNTAASNGATERTAEEVSKIWAERGRQQSI